MSTHQKLIRHCSLPQLKVEGAPKIPVYFEPLYLSYLLEQKESKKIIYGDSVLTWQQICIKIIFCLCISFVKSKEVTNEHGAFDSKKTGICKNVLSWKKFNWFANDAKICINKRKTRIMNELIRKPHKTGSTDPQLAALLTLHEHITTLESFFA